LVFITNTFTVSTVVVVPANAMVVIVVILQPTKVVVQQMQVAQNAIRCEAGMVNIPDGGANFVIDGGGEDCIRAEGNCIVTINAENITLQDCEHGNVMMAVEDALTKEDKAEGYILTCQAKIWSDVKVDA
jgi:hypothetical protein